MINGLPVFYGQGLVDALDNGLAHPLLDGGPDLSHEAIKNFLLIGYSKYQITYPNSTSGAALCSYQMPGKIREVLGRTWSVESLADEIAKDGRHLISLSPHYTLQEHCFSRAREGEADALPGWIDGIVSMYRNSLTVRSPSVVVSIGCDIARIFSQRHAALSPSSSRSPSAPESLLGASQAKGDSLHVGQFVAGVLRSLIECERVRINPRYTDGALWAEIFDAGQRGCLSDTPGVGPLPRPCVIAYVAARCGREFPSSVSVVFDESKAMGLLAAPETAHYGWSGWLVLPRVNSLAGAVLVEDAASPGHVNVFLFHRSEPVCFLAGVLAPGSEGQWLSKIDSFFSGDSFVETVESSSIRL